MSAVKRVLWTDPGVDWEASMQARLLYEGPLLGSSRDNPRARHKHEIRKIFHKQLRNLWEFHPDLKEMYGMPLHVAPSVAWRAEQFKRLDNRFVPLIYEQHGFYARVDVLMLRLNDKPSVVQQGDIDGRLKTLFDALRMPKNLDELGGLPFEEDEKPFYCVLEDDNLISHASIEADYLLKDEAKSDRNYSHVILTVTVKRSRGDPAS